MSSKMNGNTLDIKEENIEKLKELFPEVDSDGKIDFESLKQILGEYVEDSEERYKFTWNGKGEALRISQTPSMGTLRPAPEESKNWDETENLYIEGDNLEVLKLLQKTYFNKVKMIYIDPPYNTGGDFVYEDNFKESIQNYKRITGQVDSEGNLTTTNREYSGRYHTDWLNMMYPRLRLSKNLLTDDGVIFISIDEREQANLKKICDEIFGEENFVELFVWTKTSTPPSLSTKSRKTVEYILCYEKKRNNNKYKGEALDNSDAPLLNTGNPLQILTFPKGTIKFNIDDGIYEIGKYERVNLLDELTVINGLNENEIRIQGEFKWVQTTVLDEIKKGTYFLIKTLNFSVRFQRVTVDENYKSPTNFINSKQMEIELDRNLQVGTNETANNELRALQLKNYFDYPKPVGLLKYLIKAVTANNDIILDFFSGSSTTADATMKLNAEDKYKRKFIMVQLPEPIDEKAVAHKSGYRNIADIGKERIRRAGEIIKLELQEKYEEASAEEKKSLKKPEELDIGFKTFKLDTSNIKEWNPGVHEDIQLAIEDSLNPYIEKRTEQDVVYEMILKMGLDLTYPVEKHYVENQKIYSIGYGFLQICLSDKIELSVAKKMIEIKEKNNQNEFRVIFRDEGFNSDTDKTNVKETLKSAGLAEESFRTL